MEASLEAGPMLQVKSIAKPVNDIIFVIIIMIIVVTIHSSSQVMDR